MSRQCIHSVDGIERMSHIMKIPMKVYNVWLDNYVKEFTRGHLVHLI